MCQIMLYYYLRKNHEIIGIETEHVRRQEEREPSEEGHEIDQRLLDDFDIKGEKGATVQ